MGRVEEEKSKAQKPTRRYGVEAQKGRETQRYYQESLQDFLKPKIGSLVLFTIFLLTGGCFTMNENSTINLKQFVLNRVAIIEEVPVEQLVIEARPCSILSKYDSVWTVHNSEIEPLTERVVAVDKSGKTLWLNNPDDNAEFVEFIHCEELTRRFVDNPKMIITVLLDLQYNGIKLLENLYNIENIDDEEHLRLKRWEKKFTPPQIHPGEPFLLEFWTWSYRTGNLERWSIKIGHTKMSINRKVLEQHLGEFLPRK